MSRVHDLQEDMHFRVLSMLERNPDISQRELARALDVSLGGVNYALKALISRGMVKVQNFSRSDRKLAYAYVLTPQGLAEKAKLTGSFLLRKLAEYESLKLEIESLQKLMNDKAQSVQALSSGD